MVRTASSIVLWALFLGSGFASSPASAATHTFTGNITTGPQFDLHTLSLLRGAHVEARLVCDFDGVSRPLDPVLSAFFPGSDPSNTINADVFNDDGYGTDDDPDGVDCDAFDSSRFFFTAPETGTYTFRADGFGSSTGPYTLTIITTPLTDLDFDGDNHADLGVFRGSSGAFLVIQSSDGTLLNLCCAAPGDQPVPADYDGDFKTDAAVYRPSTGVIYIVQSSTQTIHQRKFPDPSPGDHVVPADYDGDGKADPARYRPSTGRFTVLHPTDSVLREVCCGAPTDVAVPADYDGDGLTDIALFRPSSGTFFILRTTDAILEERSYTGPQPGDRPVPADYDGDFKSDIALYRASIGRFLIVQSSDAAFVQRDVFFASASLGDQPVPSDYDGDGMADLGIFRGSTGAFFVLRSSDNGLTQACCGSAPARDRPLK